MYYDEMLETAVETDVLSEVQQKSNKTTAVLNPRADNNYEKYKIPFNNTWKDGRFYKNIVIEHYGSGQQGSKIRNAVTGQRYPFLVGSSDEDLFFKVSEASGRNGRKSTLILFYDSPEQYENHHFINISQDVKDRWQEKNMEARRRLDN